MPTMPIGVHSADLIGYLRDTGTPVSRRQLFYAASTGKIPRPFATRSGDFSWRPEDAGRVIAFFETPRPSNRPRRPC